MGVRLMSVKIGEVVEANTSEFLAQCYELYQAPPFGSLVKTGEGSLQIYGIVYNAATTSIEPGRRPIARGKEEMEEKDIYRTNPQLAKLFRTDFHALVVGHREGDSLYHYLPPRPARIHNFVYLCDLEEVKEFSQSLDFLSIVVAANIPGSTEELIAACLRYASQAYSDQHSFLVKAGKELALLLGGELSRLNTILKRVKQ